MRPCLACLTKPNPRAVSFGIAQAAARRTAINTASRQQRSGKLLATGVPWGTLIINVTGSFLIGAFVGLFAAKWDLSQATRIFLTVGICGG